MTITGLRIELAKGQDETLRFNVAGAAGATAATFFVAFQPSTASEMRDLEVDSAGGAIILTADGVDLIANVTLTAAQTESLPVGYRTFELWVTKGQHKPASTGTVIVLDSLRN